MIESFIIALREGIEIALVIGILVVYLRKIERPRLILSVYYGLALALLASVAGALILQRLAIDQESLEGYFQLVAAFFVVSMVVWMWFTGKHMRSEIEGKVHGILSSSSSWRAVLGILGFTFFMVVREGIETAIFLQAVAFGTNGWGSLAGTLLGFGGAAAFAVLFIRGSVRIDIVRFLKVTAVTLVIFTLQLIADAAHEFYENGILPANPKMMGILGPIVQREVLFIIAIMSIPAIMFLIPGRASAQGESRHAPRRWQLSAAIASVGIILFLGVGEMFSSGAKVDFSSTHLTVPPSGLLEIPVSHVGDNGLHRYAITDDSLEIRFFVLRTGLGSFITAFDACYACYSYGHYYLKNGELICSQCDAPSPIMKLKATGEVPEPDPNNSGSMEGNGCAPIYLPSRLHDGNIEIRLTDLQKRRKYFDIGPVQ